MRLYIDFDNTLVNSTRVIVEMLNEKFNEHKNYNEIKRYDFKDLFPQCTYWDIEKFFSCDEMFKRIKLYENVQETLIRLGENFEEICVVTIGTKENLEKKKKWLKENIFIGMTFCGIENHGTNSKEMIDMSDGILIDDHIDCLHKSNAKIKILIKNVDNGEWNKVDVNDDIYVVNDWYELNDILTFISKNKEMF